MMPSARWAGAMRAKGLQTVVLGDRGDVDEAAAPLYRGRDRLRRDGEGHQKRREVNARGDRQRVDRDGHVQRVDGPGESRVKGRAIIPAEENSVSMRTTEQDGAAWQRQRVAQITLFHQYRAWAAAGYLPSMPDVGFSVNSQNDEDGLLLYVFAHAGFNTRIAVEIAAGDGIECNAANLLLHHGFIGLLFEANVEKREAGEAFYQAHPATAYFPPKFVDAWVTRGNVNQLVAEAMFPGVLAQGGEIDLLSLDIDGNDYWILDALFCVQPRVIILEFNALWGAARAVTIPYAEDFVLESGPVAYCGASLPAFVKLLGKRDYRLVGAERLGFNAVFVRNDLAPALPEVTAASCMAGPVVSICQAGLAADPRLGAEVRSRPWVEV
jgi:hypothetical protein